MSRVTGLRVIDTQGQLMECAKCDLSGDDPRIAAQLQRALASKVNAFYKHAKEESLFRSAPKDASIKIYENDEGNVVVQLKTTGRRGGEEVTLDEETDDEELVGEAQEIIEIARKIWGRHEDSHFSSRRGRGRTRESLSDTDSVSSRPHRHHRSTSASHHRHKTPHHDRVAKLTSALDKARRTSRSHIDRGAKRAENLILGAARLNTQARNVLRKHASEQTVPVETITGLIDKISVHREKMGKLIPTLSKGNETRDILQDLDVELDGKVTALRSLLLDKNALGEFQEVFTHLMGLSDRLRVAGPDETKALVEEFETYCTSKLEDADAHPGIAGLVNAIQNSTYFYAHSLRPDYRAQDPDRRTLEGKWLFTEYQKGIGEGAGQDFPNESRGQAIKFSLMQHFASFTSWMTGSNAELFKDLFTQLSEDEQRDIFFKFAEFSGEEIRHLDSDSLARTLDRLRDDFLGDPVDDNTFSQGTNEQRREAIVRWIIEELNQSHGKDIRGLLKDNAALQRDHDRLALQLEDLDARLHKSESQRHDAHQQIQRLESEFERVNEERTELGHNLERLQRQAQLDRTGFEHDIELLQQDKTNLGAVVQRLRETIAEKGREIDTLDATVLELREKLARKTREYQSLEHQHRELGLRFEAANTLAVRTERQLRDEIDRLGRGNTALGEEVGVLQRAALVSTEALAQLRSDLSERTLQLEHKTHLNETQLREIEALRGQVTTLTREGTEARAALEERIRILSGDNHELSVALGALRDEAFAKGRIADDLRRRLETLQHDSTADKSTISILRAQLEEAVSNASQAQARFAHEIELLTADNLDLRSQIRELLERTQRGDNLVASLQEQVPDLESALRKGTRANQAAQKEIAHLTRQLAKATSDAERAGRHFQAEIDRLKKENRVLGEENLRQLDTIAALRLETAEHKRLAADRGIELGILTDSLTRQRDANLRLTSQLDATTKRSDTAAEALSTAQERILVLTGENEIVPELRRLLSEKTEEAADLNRQLIALRSQFDEQGRLLTEVTAERDRLLRETDGARRAADKDQHTILGLRHENAETLRALEKAGSDLVIAQNKVTRFDQLQLEKSRRIHELTGLLKVQAERADAFEAELTILRPKLLELTAVTAERDQLLERVRVLEEAAELSRQTALSTQETIDGLRDELRVARDNLRLADEGRSAAQKDVARLTETGERREKEIQRLQKLADDNGARANDLAKRLQELTVNLERQALELDHTSRERDRFRNEAAEATSELSKLTAKHSTALSSLEDAQRTRGTAIERVTLLERQGNSNADRIAELERLLTIKTDEAEGYKRDLALLRTALEAKTKDLEPLQRTHEQLTARIRKLEAAGVETGAAQDELAQLRLQFGSLERDLLAATNERDSLRDRVRDLESAGQDTAETNRNLRQRIDSLSSENDTLRLEVTRLSTLILEKGRESDTANAELVLLRPQLEEARKTHIVDLSRIQHLEEQAGIARDELTALRRQNQQQLELMAKAAGREIDTRDPLEIVKKLRALLDAEKRRYSERELAYSKELSGKDTEIVRIREAARIAEAGFIDKTQEAATLRRELDAALHHISELERQLKEQAEAAEIATRSIATQYDEADFPGARVFEDLSAGVASRVPSPGLDQVEQVVEIRIDETAFGRLSDAVQNGRIDMLLEPQDEVTRNFAPVALFTLLNNSPAEAGQIYNLAIFTAHASPLAFNNAGLAEALQSWLMVRAGNPALSDGEKRKLNTLMEAFKANNLDALYSSTENALVNVQAVQKALQNGLRGTPLERWQWAAKALEHPKNQVEFIFAERLKAALERDAGLGGPILNPDRSSRNRSGSKGAQIAELSAEQQLLRGRFLTVDPTGKPLKYAFFEGHSAEYDTWVGQARRREGRILELLAECSDFSTWSGEANLAKIQAPASLEEPVLLAPQPLPASATLKELQRQYAANRQELLADKDRHVQAIEHEITSRLCALTNLDPTDPTVCATTVIEQALTLKLPPVLDRVLCHSDPHEYMVLSELIYWHSALSNWREIPNARAQQSKFAVPSDWAWLMKKGDPNPIHQADRLLAVTKNLREHPKLQGSPLTPFQVKWAEKLANLMFYGQPAAIYDEAGAGKTDTADFTLGLLNGMFRNLPEVHWLSPFATKTVVPGVVMHKLEQFSGKIAVPVLSSNAVVIVDEGHKLVPESADLDNPATSQVSLVLREGDGTETPVDWLAMTATPVIPAIPLKMEQEFSAATLKEYSKAIEQLEPKLIALQEARELHLPEIQAATKKRRIAEQRQAFLDLEATLHQFREDHKQGFVMREASLPTWIDCVNGASAALIRMVPAQEPTPAYREQLKLLKENAKHICTYLTNVREKIHSEQLVELARAGARTTRGQELALAHQAALDKIDEVVAPVTTCLKALVQCARTTTAATPGPYDDDRFTPQIARLEDELAFLQDKVAKLSARNVQIERFRKLEEELAQRGERPTPLQLLELGFTEEQAFAMTLPDKRKAQFDTVQYERAAALTTFGHAEVGTSMDAALAHINSDAPALQLLFPGVRFTETNFTDPLLNTIVQKVGIKYPGKEVHILYHDSHSATDGPDYGKDFLLIYDTDGTLVSKTRLNTMDQAKEIMEARGAAVNVMLYDNTNQQGGDFGFFSTSTASRPIDQILFYDLTNDLDRNPVQLSTANDTYQALRRRRGTSARKPILMAAATKQNFFKAIDTQQAIAERYHAAGEAAYKIARRLLKTAARGSQPDFQIKGKSIRQITREVSSLTGAPLAEVNLVEQIRHKILTGKTATELGALERASQSATERVLARREEGDDAAFPHRLVRSAGKIRFFSQWVESIR